MNAAGGGRRGRHGDWAGDDADPTDMSMKKDAHDSSRALKRFVLVWCRVAYLVKAKQYFFLDGLFVSDVIKNFIYQ